VGRSADLDVGPRITEFYNGTDDRIEKRAAIPVTQHKHYCYISPEERHIVCY
jgi:hypothetical protein